MSIALPTNSTPVTSKGKTMATAKVRLRIKSVKYEGFTLQQQADWWREVIKADRRHAGDGLFLPWIRENWDALRCIAEESFKRAQR